MASTAGMGDGSHWDRLAALPWLFALTAVMVAAMLRGPLLYDGSFFLYNVLESQGPFLPDGRVLAAPAQIVVVGASQLTEDTWTLALVFSVVYLAFVLGLFALAVLVVRRAAPRLQAYPLLGLALVAPIAMDTTTEALQTVALAYPLVILATRPKGTLTVLAMVAATAALFTSHPASLVVFALTAAVLLLRTARAPAGPAIDVILALGLLVLAAVRLRVLQPGYEQHVADPGVFLHAATGAVGTVSALWIAGGWVGAAGLLQAGRGRGGGSTGRMLPWVVALLLVPLPLRLALGGQWPPVLDYRFLVVLLNAPVLAAMALDALLVGPSQGRPVPYRAVGGLALVGFGAVLALQAWRWNGEVVTARAAIAAVSSFCAPDSTMGGGQRATSHWGGRSLALILQGRRPHTVLGSPAECGELSAQRQYSASSAFPYSRPADGGWFRLPAGP